MDLVVTTKDYCFSLDGVELSLVIIFMEQYLKTCVTTGTYWLTKKEIVQLIKYIEDNQSAFELHPNNYTFLIDRFKSMEMLMSGEEKAKFYFW